MPHLAKLAGHTRCTADEWTSMEARLNECIRSSEFSEAMERIVATEISTPSVTKINETKWPGTGLPVFSSSRVILVDDLRVSIQQQCFNPVFDGALCHSVQAWTERSAVRPASFEFYINCNPNTVVGIKPHFLLATEIVSLLSNSITSKQIALCSILELGASMGREALPLIHAQLDAYGCLPLRELKRADGRGNTTPIAKTFWAKEPSKAQVDSDGNCSQKTTPHVAPTSAKKKNDGGVQPTPPEVGKVPFGKGTEGFKMKPWNGDCFSSKFSSHKDKKETSVVRPDRTRGFFKDIVSEKKGAGREEKPDRVSVRCTAVCIPQVGNMMYSACPWHGNKLQDKFCARCNKDVEPTRRFVFTALFSDNVDERWATLFDDCARKLFGMTATEMEAKATADGNFITKKVREALHTPMLCTFRSQEQESGTTRLFLTDIEQMRGGRLRAECDALISSIDSPK